MDLCNLVLKRGNTHVKEIILKYPASYGEQTSRCVQPIKTIIKFYRARQLPIWLSTKNLTKAETRGHATRRLRTKLNPDDYKIHKEIDVQPSDQNMHKV